MKELSSNALLLSKSRSDRHALSTKEVPSDSLSIKILDSEYSLDLDGFPSLPQEINFYISIQHNYIVILRDNN